MKSKSKISVYKYLIETFGIDHLRVHYTPQELHTMTVGFNLGYVNGFYDGKTERL
jgi:hypothetical protein